MKKSLALILILVFSLQFTVLGFAEDIQSNQIEASTNIVERFNELYQLNGGNTYNAIEALISENESLELKEYKTTSYSIINGELIPISARSTNPSDISFTDSIVYDNDWDAHVYLGSWQWDKDPYFSLDLNETIDPWDMIGFYTQDSSKVRAREYFVYGYDSSNKRTIYYNSDSQSSSGDIQKGLDTLGGVAFWHNEMHVDHGTMNVPLYTFGDTTGVKVMMQYSHAWSATDITGIGGSISKGNYGFNISWDRNVLHWAGDATSYGVSVP